MLAAYSSMWVSGIPRKQISGKDSRLNARTFRFLILAYCKFSRLYIEENKSVKLNMYFLNNAVHPKQCYASSANVFVNYSVLVCYNLFLCGCKIFCGSHHGETRGGEVLAVAGDDDLGILGQGREVLEGILKVSERRVE